MKIIKPTKDKASSLSAEERHRLLIRSSINYMAGKISHEAFREDERQYMADYEALTLKLGSLGRLARLIYGRLVSRHQRTA